MKDSTSSSEQPDDSLPEYLRPDDTNTKKGKNAGRGGGGPMGGVMRMFRRGQSSNASSSLDGDVTKQSTEGSSLAVPPWSDEFIDAVDLASSSQDFDSNVVNANAPMDVLRASRALWKVGWMSWWIQLVLTIIAAVIVVFAFAFPGINIRSTASASGFVLAGVGVVIAFISLFWSYGYTRLAIRLRRKQQKFMEKAPNRVGGYIRIGLVLSIMGLMVSLFGLQAVVGTLLARLLSSGIATSAPIRAPTGPSGSYQSLFQGVEPVDILVVQASANAMMALLSALISAVWLRGRLAVWTKEKPN